MDILIQEWCDHLAIQYYIFLKNDWLKQCVVGHLSKWSKYSRISTSDQWMKEKEAVLEDIYKQVLLNDLVDIVNYSILPIDDAKHRQYSDTSIRTQQLTGGPYLMQINQTKNISEPFETRFDHDGSSFRTLRFHLTDGKHIFHAIEHRFLSSISSQLTPGTKVLIKDVPIRRGILLFNETNIRILGGSVERLSNSNSLDKNRKSIINQQSNNNNQNNNNNNNINKNQRQPIQIQYQNDNNEIDDDIMNEIFDDHDDNDLMFNDHDVVHNLNGNGVYKQQEPPKPSTTSGVKLPPIQMPSKPRPISLSKPTSLASIKTTTTTATTTQLKLKEEKGIKKVELTYLSQLKEDIIKFGGFKDRYYQTLAIVTGCSKDSATITDGSDTLQVKLSKNFINNLMGSNQQQNGDDQVIITQQLSYKLCQLQGIFSLMVKDTSIIVESVDEPEDTFISYLEATTKDIL